MDYTVKKSTAGLGLFALRPYKKGELIIEYTGDIITPEEADLRGGQYLFEVNKKITIDGKGRENKARYINHACKPNAESKIQKGRVFIYAIKNIAPGDEFTYDYGKEFWKEYIKPKGCKCVSCVKKAAMKTTPVVKKATSKK